MAQANHKEVNKHDVAVRLLQRKSGVTVEKLAAELELDGTKAARGIIDRLRSKGLKVKNVGSHTFQLRTRRNPSSARA